MMNDLKIESTCIHGEIFQVRITIRNQQLNGNLGENHIRAKCLTMNEEVCMI